MLTPHHLKSLLSSFVFSPAYTCSHILTNEHDPHHYDVVKLRAFWKLMNSQECVWETRYHQITKTILQEKVIIHYSITIWCTNLFLCLKLWKFRQRKQQWTRNGKKLAKISAWNLTKVKSKKQVIDEARTSGATVHFASLMDTSLIWKMLNWRQNTRNTKVEMYSVVILQKIILDFMQYSQNKDLQHLKWQRLRSWISSPDCLVAMDKQQTQYQLIPK